nr:uncharacterized protein LOC106037799 [Anser cygnoides]
MKACDECARQCDEDGTGKPCTVGEAVAGASVFELCLSSAVAQAPCPGKPGIRHSCSEALASGCEAEYRNEACDHVFGFLLRKEKGHGRGPTLGGLWGFLLPAFCSRESCGAATECQKPALELRVPPAAALQRTGTLPPTADVPRRSGGQVTPPPPGPAPGRGRRHFPPAPPGRRHPALSAGPRPLGGVACGGRQRALPPLGKGDGWAPPPFARGRGSVLARSAALAAFSAGKAYWLLVANLTNQTTIITFFFFLGGLWSFAVLAGFALLGGKQVLVLSELRLGVECTGGMPAMCCIDFPMPSCCHIETSGRNWSKRCELCHCSVACIPLSLTGETTRACECGENSMCYTPKTFLRNVIMFPDMEKKRKVMT